MKEKYITSENELLAHLRAIQDYCKNNEKKCSRCLLRTAENDCGVIVNSNGDLYESPLDWELKNEEYPRLILN